MSRFSDPNDDTPVVKVCLVGDSSVGKSSLFLRLFDNTFVERPMLTLGVDFKADTLYVDDEAVKVHVWDTAGQERFRATPKSTFRNVDAVLVVYDLTDAESFGSLDKWVSDVEQFGSPNVVKALAANKLDKDASRAVSRAEGKAFADVHGMLFFETSAKGGVNVVDTFHAIVRRCLQVKRDLQKAGQEEAQKGVSVTTPETQGGRSCCGK